MEDAPLWNKNFIAFIMSDGNLALSFSPSSYQPFTLVKFPLNIHHYMNYTPVHVVLVIVKHLPENNHAWPTASTNMCKDFSYGSTLNEQNSFRCPQNNLLNIILGLSELFSSTGTNAKTREQCQKVKAWNMDVNKVLHWRHTELPIQ